MNNAQALLAQMRLARFLFGLLFLALGLSGVVGIELSAAWVSAALLAAAGIAGLLKTTVPRE